MAQACCAKCARAAHSLCMLMFSKGAGSTLRNHMCCTARSLHAKSVVASSGQGWKVAGSCVAGSATLSCALPTRCLCHVVFHTKRAARRTTRFEVCVFRSWENETKVRWEILLFVPCRAWARVVASQGVFAAARRLNLNHES
jgi:hypothetical protein